MEAITKHNPFVEDIVRGYMISKGIGISEVLGYSVPRALTNGDTTLYFNLNNFKMFLEVKEGEVVMDEERPATFEEIINIIEQNELKPKCDWKGSKLNGKGVMLCNYFYNESFLVMEVLGEVKFTRDRAEREISPNVIKVLSEWSLKSFAQDLVEFTNKI